MMRVPQRVLIVDDEPKITEVVGSYLSRAGYEPLTAAGGGEALQVFEKKRPALVILDLMLPDLPGEEVCRRLRTRSRVPIIMLTAKIEEDHAVRGLEMGADDYVTKPFSPRELVARVDAVLRRAADTGSPAARMLCFNGDDLSIDDATRTVRKAGAPVSITPREFRLLRLFAGNPGHVFSREELISLVFGDDFNGCDRTVDAHVKNLRQKIETDPRAPRYIHTVHGIGYRLSVEESS